jgi:imidazolonepropionase-like amidohydrolase
MKGLRFSIVFVALGALLGAQGANPAGPVVFEGARLLDGTGSPPVEDSVIVVENGHFTAVGPRASTKVPAKATHVNVAGKTVMPGMINAHVHIGYEGYTTWRAENYTFDNVVDHLTREAYYGTAVTTSVGTNLEAVAEQVEKAQQTRKLPAISTFQWLPGFAPPNGGPDQVLRVATNQLHVVHEVTTPDEARAEVRKLAGRKIKWLKLWYDDRGGSYPKLTPETAIAIIDEAHKQHMIVQAHATQLDDQKFVVKNGADVLVHMVQNVKIDDELMKLLAEKKPYWATVITLGDVAGVCQRDPFFEDALPQSVIEKIRATTQRRGLTANCGPNPQPREETMAYNFPHMIQAGAGLVLGTDTGIEPGHTFGSGEHVELARWVNLGLTAADAIVAATSRPAQLFGLSDMGSIARGKRASFIVLDANPLDDIHNTRKINAVYLDGTKVDREGLLAKWKQANAAK